MSPNLFNDADFFGIREPSTRKVIYHVDQEEKCYVKEKTNEVAYFLYEYYRTAPLPDADAVSDEAVARILKWPVNKVARYRRVLEKERLVHFYTVGGITRMIAGVEPVALFHAGLPPKIANNKAFKRLKRKFGVIDEATLLKQVSNMARYYKDNMSDFS